MLYLIGGASRSGKTIIAERLLQEQFIPRFGTDYFTSSFKNYPEAGIHHEDDTLIRAAAIWPFLSPMLKNLVEEEPQYCVEGEVILPEYAAEIHSDYPSKIRACFIGYPDIGAEEKLQTIRSNSGHINDWVSDLSDDEVLELINRGISHSQFLQSESLKYNFPFFNTSASFSDMIENAIIDLLHENGNLEHELTAN